MTFYALEKNHCDFNFMIFKGPPRRGEVSSGANSNNNNGDINGMIENTGANQNNAPSTSGVNRNANLGAELRGIPADNNNSGTSRINC